VIAFVTVSQAACRTPQAALTQLIEARRLVSELHVQFTQAADAANRAVMADADDVSAAAVEEARRAREIVERNVQALRPILESLGYAEDMKYLNAFNSRYDEYRRLDDEILPLTTENTNVKAQRLSFGPSREAADAFRTSIVAALQSGTAKGTCSAELAGARAQIGLLEIQAIYARHIAEAEDVAMTRMEEEMATSAASARKALDELRMALTPAATSQLTAAGTALDRFMSINKEIIALSRRNSEVRSLALSLGRKRVVAAECQAQLQGLEDALAKHEFSATR
jgi:hypothetical protein